MTQVIAPVFKMKSVSPSVEVMTGKTMVALFGRVPAPTPRAVVNNRCPVRSARMSQVARLHALGVPTRQISEELGIATYLVHNDLRELGLQANAPITRQSREIMARREKVKKMVQTSMFHREMAEELGVSIDTIYSDIKVIKLKSKQSQES